MPATVALLLDSVGDRRGNAGNVRLLVELARGLQELGHSVSIVAYDHDPAGNVDERANDLDIRAVNVGAHSPVRSRRELLSRYWVRMREMADLVPAGTEVVNAHDWPSLRAGAIASRRLGIPLIWTRNDASPWEQGVIPGRVARPPGGAARLGATALGLFDLRDARRARAIAVLSGFDAGMVRTAFHRPARVLRIGCAQQFFDTQDRSAAREELGVARDEFLVAAVALLVPYRRFEDLIDAVAELGDDPAVRCRIVGSDHHDPGYADALDARIRSLGLAERVQLHRSAISEVELRRLYSAADVYVFPPLRQSYGQAPLEALASGTPVIVSSGAGVHEVLKGRAGVHVVEPCSPGQIAAAIRAERKLARDRVQPTRDWLRDELSNARYARAMSELIERLARSG
jgi:glycosyltransferase involved in cell wall biosynthesis